MRVTYRRLRVRVAWIADVVVWLMVDESLAADRISELIWPIVGNPAGTGQDRIGETKVGDANGNN